MSEPPNGNAGTIQKIIFSSDALPAELDERARFALWRNLHEEHFGSTDLYFLTDREFSVHVEFAQLGAVGLGRLAGTMRRIARTRRHLAADPRSMCCDARPPRAVDPLLGACPTYFHFQPEDPAMLKIT